MSEEKLVVFKLGSGEEIIGKFATSDGVTVQVRSPLRVERIMGGTSMYYTLRAWLIIQFEDYEERIIGINADHIMAQMMPGQNVIEQYNSTLDYLMSPSEEVEADSDMPDGVEWPDLPGGGRLQ